MSTVVAQMRWISKSLEEKESRGLISKETFLVFGKCDADGFPSDPSRLTSVLPNDSQNYVSHSTRTYRIDGELYYIILYQLEVPLFQATLKADMSLLYAAKYSVGIHHFGDHPKVKEKDCLVQYLLNREVANSGSFDSDVLTFDYIPCSLGSCLTYKGYNLPIWNTHDKNMPGSIPVLKETNEYKASHLELEARCSDILIIPRCVNHLEEGVDILYPGSNLSDAYKLFITHTPSHGDVYHAQLGIEVSSVTAELIEVVKYIDFSSEPTLRVLWEAKINLLLVKSVNQEFTLQTSDSGRSAKIDLPSDFYHCYLPDVGPTFITERLKRSYFIRYVVQVKHMSSLVKLTVVNPLYIALIDSGGLPKIHSKPESSYNHMLFFEQMHKSQLGPTFSGSKPLQIFKEHGFEYKSHQMETLRSQDDLFTVTKVEFYSPQEVNVKDEELISLKGPSECIDTERSKSSSQNCRITCLVVKQSKSLNSQMCCSSSLHAGPFYEVEGRLTPCKLPVHGSPYSMGFHWKFSFTEWRSWCRREDCVYDYMRLHLGTRKRKDFCPINGAFVLVPKENLSDFLSISLKCPARFSYNTWWLWRSGFRIKQIAIKLDEHNYEIASDGSLWLNKTTTELVTRNCVLSSKDHLQASDKIKFGAKAAMFLPLEAYEAPIPALQPTTYTNSFTRVHWLRVSIVVHLNHHRKSNALTATVPIQIAADRDRSYRSLDDAQLLEKVV